MFLRWIERKHAPQRYGKDKGKAETVWTAVLVESQRVDGAPRQRHRATLGTIGSSRIEHAGARCRFWDDAMAAFAKLGKSVPAEDRQRFEAALAARVPRPSRDEYLDAARDKAASTDWECLSKPQQAALADEADQWRDRKGDAVSKIAAAMSGTQPKSATVADLGDAAEIAALRQQLQQAQARIAALKAAAPATDTTRLQLDNDELRRTVDTLRSHIEHGLKVRKAVMSGAEFKTLRSAVHPDSRRSASDEKLAAAFRILNKYQIALDRDDAPPQGKRLTLDELRQMKVRADREKLERKRKKIIVKAKPHAPTSRRLKSRR